MRAYSNMPTHEFVAQIRDIAINAKASPLVIDQIDAIPDAYTDDEIEKQCDKARNEGYDEGRSDGREAQFELCMAVVLRFANDNPDLDLGALVDKLEESKPQ